MRKTGKKSEKHSGFRLVANTRIDEFEFLKNVVEQLAGDRRDIHGYSRQRVHPRWKAIDLSSVEATVSGTLSLTEKGLRSDSGFAACFLFTCVKARGADYDLAWSSSLS